MRLFLYGTLREPAELARRAGVPGLGGRCRPARLAGFRRVALDPAGRWPTLTRARGGVVEGVLVEAGATALARLAAFEGPAYQLVRVVVSAADGETAAFAWIAAGGSDRAWAAPRHDTVRPKGEERP